MLLVRCVASSNIATLCSQSVKQYLKKYMTRNNSAHGMLNKDNLNRVEKNACKNKEINFFTKH